MSKSASRRSRLGPNTETHGAASPSYRARYELVAVPLLWRLSDDFLGIGFPTDVRTPEREDLSFRGWPQHDAPAAGERVPLRSARVHLRENLQADKAWAPTVPRTSLGLKGHRVTPNAACRDLDRVLAGREIRRQIHDDHVDPGFGC